MTISGNRGALEETNGKFGSVLNHLASKTRPFLLFTELNVVSTSMIKNPLTILDVGCGKGEPMQFINRNKNLYVIGLDLFKPYLRTCKKLKVHDDLILCDLRALPLRNKVANVVICTEVLEHLTRVEGVQLIENLEKIACKQVIITTPVGEYEQTEYDFNPYQVHRWIWTPGEFWQFGYRVRGVGLRNFGGDKGIARKTPNIFLPLVHLIWVFSGLISYIRPSYAGHIVCTKSL
jgi:SAM-dependent methyltransferase